MESKLVGTLRRGRVIEECVEGSNVVAILYRQDTWNIRYILVFFTRDRVMNGQGLVKVG